jgi:hypothetical protein
MALETVLLQLTYDYSIYPGTPEVVFEKMKQSSGKVAYAELT